MKSKNSNFIGKLYYKALFPNIVAVLGGTVNVFFDGIFIGRKLGDTGLESVNQCLPVYLLLCTIGSLYASGASFLSSHALGKNDANEAKRIFHGALLDALTVGVTLCLLGFIFAGNISELLGTAESRDYVYLYLRITLIGGIAKILLYIPYAVECTDEKICEASERLRSFCKESGFAEKETMVISLALEELLTIITQNSCPPDGFADVRLLVWNDKRIIRIRAAGKRYDPLEARDESLDYMGVKMICGLAERTEYLSALGVNMLIIYI